MFSPFDINNDQDYRLWRQARLEDYPTQLEQLIVDVSDPLELSVDEHRKLLALCRKTNFAIYRCANFDADKQIPVRLGRQFGLQHLDHNWLADDDAVTSLQVNDQGAHPQYIPYTDRPIKWHTDGYYNAPQRPIQGLILHCVQSALQGGDNRLLDHDIAYIRLRDENPDFIAALMQPDVMTIPPRTDENGVVREAVTGPVFGVDARSGCLYMRYTARTRSIEWKADALTAQAVAFLQSVLEDSIQVFRARLEPGMGLLSNNVLHDRSAFEDDGRQPRLLYRARYFDRIRGTGLEPPRGATKI